MSTVLASIERILDIQPIEGADRIQVAKVLGYQSVIKKGEYAIGDLVVFIRPDTLLPRSSWNVFLWPKNMPDITGPAVRLKISKFRGCFSEGLIVPCGTLPNTLELIEGKDVTDELKILKYEKQLSPQLAGDAKGLFPKHTPKTDQENLLSNPKLIEEIQTKELVITTKFDGCSATFSYFNGEIDVCSRNLSLLPSEENLYWKIAAKYDIINKLKQLARNISIQGEIVGPKVNGNNLGLSEFRFAIFDIWDIDEKKYWNYYKIADFCAGNRLETVDFIMGCSGSGYTIEKLLEIANTNKYENGKLAEGIVVQSADNCYSEVLCGRLSFKVINQNYLLKNEV